VAKPCGIAGVRPAVADVLGHRGGEQHRLLRHDRERATQIGEAQVADVDAIDADRSRFGIVEAQQQIEDRGLARP
jgi:hypothetical protein